jgi:putative SOS response-associated peptidase YedK
MLLPYYSIGSEAVRIENQLTAEFTMHFDPVFVGKSGLELPIIQPDSIGKIISGIWGMPSLKGSLKTWFKSEGIVKNRDSRLAIRKNRCLIPANGFFVEHDEKYYFIFFPAEPVITMAGIYLYRKKSQDGPEDCHFAILTQTASSRMSRLTSVVPVIISAGSRRKYLNRQRPLMDITCLLQKEFKREFNGIEILRNVFVKKQPGKTDFCQKHSKLYPLNKFPEKEILGSYYYF